MPLDYTVAVFDLDNCLMDAREVGPLFQPAFEAVRQANQGALSPQALDQALQACWFTAFDLVAQRHHFTPAMRAAGWRQFSQMEVRAPLQGYADIGLLPRIPLRRYLVTSGFRRLQDSKIDALGIRPWFEEVLIDAIDAPPTGAGHGKQALFEQILTREGCTPREMLVVGDNPLSELAAGRALGGHHRPDRAARCRTLASGRPPGGGAARAAGSAVGGRAARRGRYVPGGPRPGN